MMLKNTTKINLLNASSNVLERVASKSFFQQNNSPAYPKNQTLKPPVYKYGFTLVELLVTLCIAGIMLTIAIPSFRTMLFNSRLNSNADYLVDALNYARSTALNQSMTVIVCPLGAINSITCGGDWSSGWIVVTAPTAGVGTLLKSQQTAPTDPVLSGTAATVSFDSHGITTTPSNFKLCDSRGGTFALSIQVLATGFVQKGTTPGQAIWDNSALACP